jgi:Ca2+-binding EF-hand superfamily protein
MEEETKKEMFYKETFNFFDRDGDGIISRPDLFHIMKMMNQEPNSEEIIEIMKINDKNKDSKICFQDFKEIMETDNDSPNQLLQAFKIFDKDGNGLVDQEELKTILENFGEYLDDKEIERMIKEIDNDGDGFISLEDFVNAMSNS